MSKKIITRVFTLMLCICSIFSFSIPVMAADSTSLYINVQYSDSISPEPDDKFVITYHAKNEEKTNEIVLMHLILMVRQEKWTLRQANMSYLILNIRDITRMWRMQDMP